MRRPITSDIPPPIATREAMREIADAIEEGRSESLEDLPDDTPERDRHPAISQTVPETEREVPPMPNMPPIPTPLADDAGLVPDPDNPDLMIPRREDG
nr:MAG: hypothetical protein H4Bulk465452_000002 [Cystoviridae sp.]